MILRSNSASSFNGWRRAPCCSKAPACLCMPTARRSRNTAPVASASGPPLRRGPRKSGLNSSTWSARTGFACRDRRGAAEPAWSGQSWVSRKILFTTNLPNVHDIDPALMRPGRCFATLHTRALTPTEGTRLISRLCGGDSEREQAAFATTFPVGTKSCSVASIYRACDRVSS